MLVSVLHYAVCGSTEQNTRTFSLVQGCPPNVAVAFPPPPPKHLGHVDILK